MKVVVIVLVLIGLVFFVGIGAGAFEKDNECSSAEDYEPGALDTLMHDLMFPFAPRITRSSLRAFENCRGDRDTGTVRVEPGESPGIVVIGGDDEEEVRATVVECVDGRVTVRFLPADGDPTDPVTIARGETARFSVLKDGGRLELSCEQSAKISLELD